MSNLYIRVKRLENAQPSPQARQRTSVQIAESFEQWQRIFADPATRAQVTAQAEQYPDRDNQRIARIVELIETAERRRNEQVTATSDETRK